MRSTGLIRLAALILVGAGLWLGVARGVRNLLEMAYDPNDCVEVRWGAAEGSPEAATCKRHLPPEQKTKMSEYRAWFHDARRPSR